jgi:predicted nucleotidyltransferase
MLETLFGSRLRARVLGWLFTHPDERYFVRQLNGLLEEDSTNLSRELARLERIGILVSTTEGKQKYYRVNRDCPVYDELHGLIVRSAGLADVLRGALAPAAEQIPVAFVFGSIAGGGEDKSSDVDVMVVGDVSSGDVVSLLYDAERKLGREVNTVVYPAAEFKKKVKEDHHFVKAVLDGEKIFMIGDESELARLAK